MWFLSHGFRKADTRYTDGAAIWLHPRTNDVLSAYGKIKLRLLPFERYKKNTTQYLSLSRKYGSMYLARLKYLTFIGDIPAGYTIDHIDGNPLNNDIRNLRAVTPAINFRDGGFLRKLRNNGINVAMFSGNFILRGFERMAEWKASHSERQYRCLSTKELLGIFVGPKFQIVDGAAIMDLEISRHQEC